MPAAPRSRLAVALACAGALVLVLTIGVGGGIAYLLVHRNATTAFHGDGYSFDVPSSWTRAQVTDTDEQAGAVLTIQDGDRTITVYDYDSTLDATSDCNQQADLLAAFYSGEQKPKDLGAVTADGQKGHHLRLQGHYIDTDRDQIQDLYCLPRKNGIVEIVATDASPADRAPVPEAKTLLESWHWG